MNPPAHVTPIVSIGRMLHCWGDWRDYDWLIPSLMAPDTTSWEIGDAGGAYMVTNITPGRTAQVNIRVNDRAYLGADADHHHLAMINYVFALFDLTRMESRAPGNNRGAINFNKRLGFEYEGLMRMAGVVDGAPSDVWLGAIIRGGQHA